ncbi:MAG: efflux RND transporter permease subunit [Flavobacteriaceae bacterium]
MDNLKHKIKEFRPSSWAIDNPSVIYVMISLFLFIGVSSYLSMPREEFPEVKETKIFISTIYPGNTAEDMERLIADPLEDRLKNISDVVEVVSTSQEDYTIITVEFDQELSIPEAEQRVKDEVDAEKASEDWPVFNGAKVEPSVFDLNISEAIPLLNVNLSGDYPVEQLKSFAEYLEDDIEKVEEVKGVDLRGVQDKEVEVAVDIYKMMSAQVSFDDVINSIRNGNMTLSAGNLVSSGQRRTIRVLGEIQKPVELEEFVVKSERGAVYLKDIAEVRFKPKETTTYAREKGQSVVMLDIKKRSGANAIKASEKIRAIVEEARANYFPPNLDLSITNDSSERTLSQVDDLVNNIIFGIILVVGVLMFFLGFKNAIFVGFAIPMSMFMSFMILSALGYTLNTMILFGLIMGLGMLVDNGVVVVENVYRLMEQEGMSRVQAAKQGIGEIAVPIIISTATTVAAFVPLGLWPGVMGQFMIYFPITLSVVLGSSLFVAIFINSMLVSKFMTVGDTVIPFKTLVRMTSIFGGLGLFIILIGGPLRGLGTLMIVVSAMFWIYRYGIRRWAYKFQTITLVRFENFYEKQLKFALRGRNVYFFFAATLMLLIAAFMSFGASVGSGRTKIEFFPDNIPNQIFVYIEYPQGTAIEKTNTITKAIEKRVAEIVKDDAYIVEDENALLEYNIAQVGRGAENPFTETGLISDMPHRGKITLGMKEFKFRKGLDSESLRKQIQEELAGIYPGVTISVEKDLVEPPSGYPVNIELEGQNYDTLINLAERISVFINKKNVAGMEGLKVDVNKDKPSMEVLVNRQKAGELNVAVGQIGMQLRRSLFGDKAGVYKKDGEDYDINVRFNQEQRYNNSALFDQRVIFRDMADGQIKEIPISALASSKNTSTFSAIKHKDGERVVSLYSGLKPGGNAVEIVAEIQEHMKGFEALPRGVSIDYTGQIEEQNKQQDFLMGAFFTGLGLIMLILIFQFKGLSKPMIIMIAIFLSLIGVFGGLMLTGWPFVIMMTMMGIIALAGIVVNNGVVLLDYADILIQRKKEELGLEDEDYLGIAEFTACVIQAGKARLRPVILTAVTTVLGLIPLAIGLNINFISLMADFDPKIYVGGDNVIFWGPLAWTVIFGLVIATFLTLIIVPVLFHISYRLKLRLLKKPQQTAMAS